MASQEEFDRAVAFVASSKAPTSNAIRLEVCLCPPLAPALSLLTEADLCLRRQRLAVCLLQDCDCLCHSCGHRAGPTWDV